MQEWLLEDGRRRGVLQSETIIDQPITTERERIINNNKMGFLFVTLVRILVHEVELHKRSAFTH